MITFTGLAFGFGTVRGHIESNAPHQTPDRNKANESRVALFDKLPSITELMSVMSGGGLAFVIIPSCSAYSHIASALWSTGMSAISISNPEAVPRGTDVLCDFDRGLLLVSETEGDRIALEQMPMERDITLTRGEIAFKPNATDSIAVLAEPCSRRDLCSLFDCGADGLGVVRAEYLTVAESGSRRDAAMSVARLVDYAQQHSLLIRFFDCRITETSIAADQVAPVDYLGYRGIRMIERDPSLAQRFLALLDQSGFGNAGIVLPMITAKQEIERARQLFGSRYSRIGATVETPAAAVMIDEIVAVAQFIEVGVNDLTQYTMAWDRDVPSAERLPPDRIARPVAALIADVVAACERDRVPYTVGLDLRPSPGLAAQLVQLGVRSISCAPALVKRWKAVLRA